MMQKPETTLKHVKMDSAICSSETEVFRPISAHLWPRRPFTLEMVISQDGGKKEV